MNAVKTLEQLQDHPVLRIFRSITEIPRASKEEARIGEWIMEFARQHGWTCRRDGIGNVLVVVPATPGHESKASVCLQAHLDMVCLDDQGNAYGDERFPLQLRLEDGWLKAVGTTLGADNGIGVALALAIGAEGEHGPLELLFTVQEETGLDGAASLEFKLESKVLLNLDSEDWKMLFIGCAGGCGITVDVEVQYQHVADTAKTWILGVSGLQGGHSGLEINKGRQNAVRVLAEAIAGMNFHQQIQLVELSGGSRSNAIPASARAIFVANGNVDRLQDLFSTVSSTLTTVYDADEPAMQFLLVATDDPVPQAASSAVTRQLLALIQERPHGVISMSPILDVPQTSVNLGVARLGVSTQKLSLTLMGRSSDAAELEQLKVQIQDVCWGFFEGDDSVRSSVTYGEGYPGWQPEPDAPLVQTVQRVWQQQRADPLQVTAIHAGLECGLLKGKYPDIEMVSLGPDIRGAHSAEERVSLASVEECYLFLQSLLKSLA